MPYTLMKGLAWVLIAVAIGIMIGWFLRSVAANRQIKRARGARPDSAEHEELERLRGRVANLEPVVNERDRLRTELDNARQQQSSTPTLAASPAGAGTAARAVVPPVPPGTGVDLASATSVLGKRITPDDLTVIEGIGPKIADLCHGIGIRTWSELSTTEVSLLRTMLNDAGQRFKAHDPTTWPGQAALLAAGSWSEFKALTEQLDGGRPVD